MSGLTSNTVTEARAFKWVGDNLGLGSDVPATIHARDQDGRLTDLSIEQTLRHIDMFAEPGRTRILWGTREIYSGEEIMVRMRYRALQLADAFYEKCMCDMAEPSQLHYHMNGDNCVEMWMPSSGASNAIRSMTTAANLLLDMAERATSREKELVVALSSVTRSVK
jgi:hypothetical protein